MSQQGDINGFGDARDGSQRFGDIDKAHAVIQHGCYIRVVHLRRFIVERAEEVVVMLVHCVDDFAVLTMKSGRTDGATSVGVDRLSTRLVISIDFCAISLVNNN